MTAENGRLPGGAPYVRVGGLEFFDIGQTFDCGQCFRFVKTDENVYAGTAFGKYVRFVQDRPDMLTIEGVDRAEYERVWKRFLTFDTDWKAVRADVAAHFGDDGVMREAMTYGAGIRILRQEPWETLCSFILSQNNNIPRIRRLIGAFCERYGEPIEHGGAVDFAFPTAEAVDADPSGLETLRAGYRARYLADAAHKAASGELDLDLAARAPAHQAEEMLCTVKGVGPKVAACVMLYGLGRTEAFPVDVWMKRVLAEYYPAGLDLSSLGSFAGLAQQYLFYYERGKAKGPAGTGGFGTA